jgi:hypothetical protein
VDLRDENGRTAADLAREEHHQDIYHFLTERVEVRAGEER